jgi:hypothetical protein
MEIRGRKCRVLQFTIQNSPFLIPLEWEYRVIAGNKAGDGPASNIAAPLES